MLSTNHSAFMRLAAVRAFARQWARTPARTFHSSAHRAEEGPVARYEAGVAKGLIVPDDGQRSIVAQLQAMHDELKNYTPPPIQKIDPTQPEGGSWMSSLFSKKKPESVIPANVPKGLYLHGTVGTGKTFVMDLFFTSVPSQFTNHKMRIHFHQFMIGVHKRLHQFKLKYGDRSDGIQFVAQELADEARVLCFDEFQVTDIVDAMILRRLLESLMSNGVVCIMTSNRTPDELYENGIQRDQFIPAIELIKERFTVQQLGSGVDYRRVEAAREQVYFTPNNEEQRGKFEQIWRDVARNQHDTEITNRYVTVWGRRLPIPLACGSAARFSFHELCTEKRAAADYIAICDEFQWIFLTDVPQLTIAEVDFARRLILFIDAAYEARVKLFILADVPADQVLDYAQTKEADESAFAFDRAVSRISEMSKVTWLHQV